MSLQILFDGILLGAVIGLGAIGVTLTYSILRFANFAHGDFISWGAYLSYSLVGLIGSAASPIGSLSFGWPLIGALCASVVLTGALALALEKLVFARLRSSVNRMVVVMASFGVSLALRSLIELAFGTQPRYFTQDIQIAFPVFAGARVTPDQLAIVATTLLLVLAVHLLLTRTHIGLSMRATGENTPLARVAGIDTQAAIRAACLLGGALAAVSGTLSGMLTQVRPYMGFDLLLPLFSAAILGGIGSVPGAVIGGLIIGISESLSVALVGAQYRAAIAFLVLIAVLLIRPNGLFGARLS
ncbi:High-affinity branched-chain amino acid transport system permease protein LivH (plasmid) [Caballeronia sp. SBC1]|uniref:branched-chain amino acid ABC transporter permease n=1 Tax=Caballeronia sp. SBC1 TaxID=2705548 RepID=UPI00140B9631|nr:branched-chain amino acid ABC transporter permease [Caballeronia sp. SBC1]QIN67939.1 High-affinity branched-chain amino acid transport system permease protein LivH [Caballeronia sp. SBC1]